MRMKRAMAMNDKVRWTSMLALSALLALASGCGGTLEDDQRAGLDDEARLTEKSGPDDLAVTIHMAKTYYGADESPLVEVTITNIARNSTKLLSWALPATETEENLFAVKLGGARVQYTGAVYKRKAPLASDFVTLAAGQAVTGTVDLALVYDLSASGQYTVQFDVVSSKLKGKADKGHPSVQSNSLSVAIDGRPAKAPGGSAGPFVKCTVAQQGTLKTAKANADTMASAAAANLAGGSPDPYALWFGVYDAGRYATVAQHFNAIQATFDADGPIAATISFDCSCKRKNVYAYVYPTQHYRIYLCGAFWVAPTSGWDTQQGTLIHEMSHFQVVASTTDYGYGRAFCTNLATTNPDQAIMNADNHEYFAEDQLY